MTTTELPKVRIAKTLYAIIERNHNGDGNVSYRVQRVAVRGGLVGEVKTLCYGARSKTYSLYSGRVGLPKLVEPVFVGRVPAGSKQLDMVCATRIPVGYARN